MWMKGGVVSLIMMISSISVSIIVAVSLSNNRLVSGLDTKNNNKFRQRQATDDALPSPNLYSCFIG